MEPIAFFAQTMFPVEPEQLILWVDPPDSCTIYVNELLMYLVGRVYVVLLSTSISVRDVPCNVEYGGSILKLPNWMVEHLLEITIDIALIVTVTQRLRVSSDWDDCALQLNWVPGVLPIIALFVKFLPFLEKWQTNG